MVHSLFIVAGKYRPDLANVYGDYSDNNYNFNGLNIFLLKVSIYGNSPDNDSIEFTFSIVY